MLWEVEVQTTGHDPERARISDEYNLLTHTQDGEKLFVGTARGYLLEGDLGRHQAEQLSKELLVDPVTEHGRLAEVGNPEASEGNGLAVRTVLLKPGVMDPAALSVLDAARELGFAVASVRTFRR